MSTHDLSPLHQKLQAIEAVHMPADRDNKVASMISRFCKAVARAYPEHSGRSRGLTSEQSAILQDLDTVRDKLRELAQSGAHQSLLIDPDLDHMYRSAVRSLLVSHLSNLCRKISKVN